MNFLFLFLICLTMLNPFKNLICSGMMWGKKKDEEKLTSLFGNSGPIYGARLNTNVKTFKTEKCSVLVKDYLAWAWVKLVTKKNLRFA